MATSMLHALIVAVAMFGPVAFGREISSYDATGLANVLRRTLAQLPASPPPTTGSSSWAYGTCNFVLQDADIVVLPAPAGARDGNLGNFTATDPGVCCAKCQESYKAWEAANLATVNKVYSDPLKSLDAILKLEGNCLGWTFIPGSSGANGTCYLKNGLNFKLLRDLTDALKKNDNSKLNSLLNSDALLAFWYFDERQATRGWFSGTLPNPSIAGSGPDIFDFLIRQNVTVLYTEPLPQPTSGCTTASERRAYICQKVLGKIKTPVSRNSSTITG